MEQKLVGIGVLFWFLMGNGLFAQKKMIDKDACENWLSLEETTNGKGSLITNNGKYVVYQYGSEKNGSTVVLKELYGSYQVKYQGAINPVFTNDNKRFVTLLPDHRLLIQALDKPNIQYLENVDSFGLSSDKNSQWLVYEMIGKERKLVLRDLLTDKEKLYVGVENKWFSAGGNVLLLKNSDGILRLDLLTGKELLLPQSKGVVDLAIAGNGNAVSFLIMDAKGMQLKYFRVGMTTSQILVNDQSDGLQKGFRLSEGWLRFSKNEGKIFFQVRQIVDIALTKKDVSVISTAVNVWSYKDSVLQETQLSELPKQKSNTYTSVVDLNTGKIIQLEDKDFCLVSNLEVSSHVLLSSRVTNDFYWNKTISELRLIKLIDGSSKTIFKSAYPSFQAAGLSPDENFVTWFDSKIKNYYSYEIGTTITRNISKQIKEPLLNSRRGEADKVGGRIAAYGGQLWLRDRDLIVYDQNDIWQIDPLSKNKPINITNGYGNQYDIRFRILNSDKPVGLDSKGEILVWAFNHKNKQNGIWKIKQGQHRDPVKLIMDDRVYYFGPSSMVTWSGPADPTKYKPIKAKDVGVFIVRRMSSSESPNLYATRDFKEFTPISNLHPEKDYNWLSSEIVTWTLPDGLTSDGILFKPENFDPRKKYPIIFNYYERRSEGLNVYRKPELTGHNINIPWYLSRGYLVFEPDMYYKTGKTAQSIIDVVTSAAKHLGKLSYVDTSRMGVQGQSFGGYETNVIATGTNIFAAACEMAGPTNIISEYGSLRPGGFNNQYSADMGQRNLSVFPWEHPEVFIKNSPVFHIGKMTTPLLMVHNREDGAILFPQALELFMAIWRAKKKAWLLEYDGEGHSVCAENNKLDFTIRMQQFFDHYLKGAPAPKWMISGIPASRKGIDSGLQLDTTGAKP